MQKTNIASLAELLLLLQFDVEEPEIYKQTINEFHAQQ